MKRLISIVLCMALLLPLCACGQQHFRQPGIFYYRRSTPVYGSCDAIIAPETRDLHALRDDLPAILALYFEGPEGRTLESPFPRDTHVISWNLSGSKLTLNLSDAFAALSGVDLTVACSCIARTFLNLLSIDHISIRVMRQTLNGQKSIELSADDIRLTDDSLDQLRTSYTLYFADQQRRYLIGMDTSLSVASAEEAVRLLVQKLMTTPYHARVLAPIPFGSKLLDVTVKNGLCTLNFSNEFETNSWVTPEAQRTTLLAIVNTLTQIDGISQVEFCTDGNLLVQYGSLSISAPFVADSTAIGPVRTGINEFDATLYLSNGSDQYLTGVPTKIRQTAGIHQTELVLKALLGYRESNGFYSVIPRGTKLNSITTDNGVCRIDLSKEILQDPELLALAFHSIVASLCTVSGVDGVQITVDGRIPTSAAPGLFRVLTPQPDWFV